MVLFTMLVLLVYDIITRKELLRQEEQKQIKEEEKVFLLNEKLKDKKWFKENINNIKSIFPNTTTNINNLKNDPQFLYKLKIIGFDFKTDEDLFLILNFLNKKKVIIFKDFLVKVK
jgi:hypothetical protein